VLDAANGPQQPHVTHDAIAGLRAAEHRVSPSLGREPATGGGDSLLQVGDTAAV